MAIKGMDISYWQGNVDFARVAADGIKFAILREGYAQTVDAKFRQYVEGCRKNGIEIKGVYHFSYAINAEQAAQEAAFCIKQMEQAGLGKDVIVFYDFEYDTVKKAKAKGVTLGKNECIAFTKAFCEYVESHGYKAGVYSNIDYHRNMYSDEVLSKYVYWLADYTGSPDYDCAFHQYTSSGTVSGIDGKVDMDYYYGEETKENQGEKKSVTEVAPARRFTSACTALQEQPPHRKRAWQKSPRKSLQDSGEMAMTERTASRQQDMTTMQSRKRSMHSLE